MTKMKRMVWFVSSWYMYWWKAWPVKRSQLFTTNDEDESLPVNHSMNICQNSKIKKQDYEKRIEEVDDKDLCKKRLIFHMFDEYLFNVDISGSK